MAFLDYKELQKQHQKSGPLQTVRFIREGLRQKWFKPDDFSIRKLAEHIIKDGRDWIDRLDPRMGGLTAGDGISLMEASGGPVDTATFSNITGQLFITRILEAAEDPAFIGDQLVTNIPTQFNGEMLPGIGGVGDDLLIVNEGNEFPLVGVTQEYIETPKTVKRGGIIEVTKEAIFFDRTGVLLQRCDRLGYWAGLNKEKEIIKRVTAQTNGDYVRNGTAYNTYYASGGLLVNKQTDALADWTDIEAAMNLFMRMTDFTTGESIVVMPKTLLVPWDKYPTAEVILNSTQVRTGTSNTTNYQTISTDPMKRIVTLTPLTSPLVYSLTSDANDWWIGDFPRAFAYMENWGITTENQGASSEAAFRRDIVHQHKASWRGVTAVIDPHYAIHSEV